MISIYYSWYIHDIVYNIYTVYYLLVVIYIIACTNIDRSVNAILYMLTLQLNCKAKQLFLRDQYTIIWLQQKVIHTWSVIWLQQNSYSYGIVVGAAPVQSMIADLAWAENSSVIVLIPFQNDMLPTISVSGPISPHAQYITPNYQLVSRTALAVVLNGMYWQLLLFLLFF